MKAAVHYTVAEMINEEQDEDLSFTKQFKAVLAEATYKYAQRMSTDLEMFAKYILDFNYIKCPVGWHYSQFTVGNT